MNVVVVVEEAVFGGNVEKTLVAVRFFLWISLSAGGGQPMGLYTFLHNLSTFFDCGIRLRNFLERKFLKNLQRTFPAENCRFRENIFYFFQRTGSQRDGSLWRVFKRAEPSL